MEGIPMTILYNCRHAGDQYRITKFNPEMNVESSYLCTLEECDCPRGPHPTGRHRQMLPQFIAREHVGDEWFLDFDRGGWVQQGPEWAHPEETGSHLSGDPVDDLPEGVTMIVMDHPDKVADIHNAIADAVGEPHAIIPKHIPRRL